MFFPALTYTCLATGVLMMSASAYVIYKVYKGSKSQFAYVLMAFTFLDGAQNFAYFFISIDRHLVLFGDQTLYVVNIYASQTINCCFLMVSLQTWIFGMKYLESAMLCSLSPPCV